MSEVTVSCERCRQSRYGISTWKSPGKP